MVDINFTIPNRVKCVCQMETNKLNEEKRIKELEKKKQDDLQREIDCQVVEVLKTIYNRLERLFDESISLNDKHVFKGENCFEFKFFSTTIKYSDSMSISAWHKQRIELIILEVTNYLESLDYRVECYIDGYCCQGVDSPYTNWTLHLFI